MSHQSVVQHELAGDGVEKIRDRMPVQIDHEYPSLRNTTHLTKHLHDLLVEKMMREQRTDHVIKLRIVKRKPQSIATHRCDLIEPLRLLEYRLRHTLIQLETNSTKLS